MIFVPTSVSSHIDLCSTVSRLLRKDRLILSDFTYFLSSCEIHGLILRIRIFGSNLLQKILRSQIIGLTPEPKPCVTLNFSFYLLFVPTEKLVSL